MLVELSIYLYLFNPLFGKCIDRVQLYSRRTHLDAALKSLT